MKEDYNLKIQKKCFSCQNDTENCIYNIGKLAEQALRRLTE